MADKDRKVTTEQVAESFNQHGGNVSAVSRDLKIDRATVRRHIHNLPWAAKPLVGGQIARTEAENIGLPPAGRIRRFILTSAQNNTAVNQKVWRSLVSLAHHYDASIMVGTFTYNTNAYGKLSVKRGTEKEEIKELWYDTVLADHIVDVRTELGPGLVWCGEMNILPTAVNPLEGLETYSHRLSAIFPHTKQMMRSVAAMQGEGAKLNYTTGTVTQHNYIQKKEGLKAELHHCYGGLIVEVNDKGNWWVRQLQADDQGRIQDLDVLADGDSLRLQQKAEAITWGDLHATFIDEEVVTASMDMLDTLRPKFQFLHDVLEGTSINRHVISKGPDPHYAFHRWLRGLHRVEEELSRSVAIVQMYLRPWCKTIAPDANHDDWWFKSWLAKYDYRYDPANAQFFLKLQSHVYSEIKGGKMSRDVNVLQKAMEECGLEQGAVQFLVADESFTICNKKIECGMHGHLGPNGAQGTPLALSKVGRRANIGHTHSAGIYDGLFVAGTSSKLRWTYNLGPSSWSHSHIVTYPNGKRTIVTMYKGCWKA